MSLCNGTPREQMRLEMSSIAVFVRLFPLAEQRVRNGKRQRMNESLQAETGMYKGLIGL